MRIGRDKMEVTRWRGTLHALMLDIFVLAVALGPLVALWLAAGPSHVAARKMLLAAAQHGDVRAVEAAVNAGAGVNERDETGFTPLMIAARAGNCEVVERLLGRGARMDAQTPIAGTALMQAAMFGRLQIVRILLAHHATVDAHNDCGETALDYARRSGDSSAMIDVLLAAGARSGVRTSIQPQ